MSFNDSSEVEISKISDNKGFTVTSSYVSDPSQVILQCGDEKISLIHLKSLELALSDDEETWFRNMDAIFQRGWLYSSIINAFLCQLSDENGKTFFMNSELALRAARQVSNVGYLKRRMESLSAVETILLPANVSNDHWLILAISITKGQIYFYDQRC